MLRVEDKYIISNTDMLLLEKRIAAFLPMDGQGYKISSIYFDDLKDSMYYDSLNGNPIRDKYRIRIYDDSLKTIKLEVKRKTYNHSYKATSIITPEEMQLVMNGQEIPNPEQANEARTLFNLALKKRGLRPKVNVTYDRNAYIYEPGNVRITFDRGIRASRQLELFGTAGLTYDYPDGTGTVLEVKYDQFLPRFIAQMLNNGKLIQTANSKYSLCREIYERRGN